MKPKELIADPKPPQAQPGSASSLEREAHRLRGEGKIDQAFRMFDQAAKLYQDSGEHLKAAVCFSSAATCWNIHTGWQPLRNAATRNEFAAIQAIEAKDYAYAESLFSEAALLYEKEGDFTKYSYCYSRAKDARLMRLWRSFTHLQADKEIQAVHLTEITWEQRTAAFLSWFFSAINRAVWGYGENPFRVFGIATGLIFFSAFCYYLSGDILTGGFIQKVSFGESLYLSIMTYTTVGYGDYLPMGWLRIIASVEALSGIFLTPLFLIALTRRYLRMYR